MRLLALSLLWAGLCATPLQADIEWGSMNARWEKEEAPGTGAPAVLGEDGVRLGDLEVRVIEAGYTKVTRQGRPEVWVPSARLIYRNLHPRRAFKRNLSLELRAANGKRLSLYKTFIHLKAKSTLERLYANPRRAQYANLAEAPTLTLRVRVGNKVSDPLVIPARELALPEGQRTPPVAEWQDVRSIADGDTLTVAGGQRIRLLGVDTPELQPIDPSLDPGGAAATEFVRHRLTNQQVRCDCPGNAQDDYRRWLCYIYLKDGSMLNEDLVRFGHARVYTRAEFPQKQAWLELEHKACVEGAGFWAQAKGMGGCR